MSSLVLVVNITLKVYSSSVPLRTYAGTPAYMAPEVTSLKATRGGTYDQKADCWSLGVILYKMLSGRLPFPSRVQDERILSGRFTPMIGCAWDRVSKEAKNLIRSLLEVDLDRRLSSEEILRHPWISSDEVAVNVARNTMFSNEN